MRAITIIFAVLLVGLKTTSAQSNDTEWKRALKSDVIKYFSPGSYPPGVQFDAGSLHIFVPVKISKELESHPKEEMVSYLRELQNEEPNNERRKELLGDWILIVSNGLRGSPTILTPGYDSIIKQFPYVRYSYSAFSQKQE
jgi:hypothetical protein